jgi:hypothetical protein
MGRDYVSELQTPTGVLFIHQMIYEMIVESHGEIILTGEPKNWRKTLSTTNSAWTDPGANPGLRGEKRTANLSHGTAD